jgi:limonene-1,2-epoxide hydrolase
MDSPVTVTRLFTEALNARDHEAARALVAEDAEFYGVRGSEIRGRDGADALLDAANGLDLVVTRTGQEQLQDNHGMTRVTVPVRERIHKRDHLDGTTVYEIRDGLITTYETLTND